MAGRPDGRGRRGGDDPKSRAGAARRGAQQTDLQEEEQEAVEQEVPEHQRLQQQYGNAALLNMLGQDTAGGDGGGGVEMDVSRRKSNRASMELGGDEPEDAPADAPLTEHDLIFGASEPFDDEDEPEPSDPPPFEDPPPMGELPPEDQDFLAFVRRQPVEALYASKAPDPYLQPSEALLEEGLRGWVRAVRRWSGTSLEQRALVALLAHPPSVLHDPDGRMLINRSRMAALASCALAEAPLNADDAGTRAFLSLCLEIEGRQRPLRAVIAHAAKMGKRLVDAHHLFRGLPLQEGGPTEPRPLPPKSRATLARLLFHWLDLPDPRGLVPTIEPLKAPAPDPDDPLGLDAAIEEATGGRPDPVQQAYGVALRGAERLAKSIHEGRVHLAGAAYAVGQVGQLWTAGVPRRLLKEALQAFDHDAVQSMQAILQVARAASKGERSPEQLGELLDETARGLLDARRLACGDLADVAGALLPPVGDVRPAKPPPADPFSSAWADGNPEAALPWLGAQPDALEREAALCLTRLAMEEASEGLEGPLERCRQAAEAEGREPLAAAFTICRGAVLLDLQAHEPALDMARALEALAIRRRNGLFRAEATLLAMEVHQRQGRSDLADEARRAGALDLWRMGAPSGLSLVARR